MTFLWPWMLVFLVLIPLAVLVYLRMQARRRQLTQRLSQFGPMNPFQTKAPPEPGFRRHFPAFLFLIGLAALLVALARPIAAVGLPRMEGTVILAFDVSGSMAAEDLQPTRMEAAKQAARLFVEDMPAGVEVGVVAFSDSGFTIQVPSAETDTILSTIDRLQPQSGTSLGGGILASLNTIANNFGLFEEAETIPGTTPDPGMPSFPVETHGRAVIVLISDGENNMSPDPLAAAQLAAENGVRIYTVGIGSPSGANVNIEGFLIHTQLDEAMLNGIAQMTGGDYYNAQNEEQLQHIYTNLAPQLVIETETIEVTALLMGASLFAMLVGGVFSLLWFNRLP